MNFVKLLEQAENSAFKLWTLNFLLHRYIPFNKPHGLRLTKISKEKVEILIPFRRKNLNHIKGLHACVLATAAEYSSGLLLLYKIGSKDYRIIMESLKVEYHYQAKMEALATFELADSEFNETVMKPLKEKGKVYKQCVIKLYDREKNHLCTAYTNWQIKAWKSVKTTLS